MTAVKGFTAVVCLFGATTLLAQMPTPTPKVVPARPTPQVTATTETVTAQVAADTDKDLNNPRTLRLSLDDALKTSMERNIGISIQRYDFLEAGQSLRGAYGIYDWLATGTYEQALRVDGVRQQELNIFDPSYPDPGGLGTIPPINKYLLTLACSRRFQPAARTRSASTTRAERPTAAAPSSTRRIAAVSVSHSISLCFAISASTSRAAAFTSRATLWGSIATHSAES